MPSLRDTFSDCHPAVNFLYFALVLAFSMTLMHPACLLISLTGACCYVARLCGLRELGRSARWLVPMALLAALVNPAFVHQGVTILTYLPTGNPLTLESILYGFAAALLLASVVLWFRCFSAVMTSASCPASAASSAPSRRPSAIWAATRPPAACSSGAKTP